ncbi:MAG: hypothetical protein PGN22_03020 [Agrobacterium cavarae]
MRVLGLDVSKHAGWALWETKHSLASIRCDVMEFPDKASIEYCADQMGLKVTKLIKDERPDFIVLETALKMSPKGTAATVSSCMLHGAVYATLGNWAKPWGTISAATWRKMFFGAGYKPPLDKHGKNDWKRAAIEQCELEGITLPTKKATRDNAAEAAALAVCWRGVEIHAGRYRPAFQDFLQQRNERTPSGDLFAGVGA